MAPAAAGACGRRGGPLLDAAEWGSKWGGGQTGVVEGGSRGTRARRTGAREGCPQPSRAQKLHVSAAPTHSCPSFHQYHPPVKREPSADVLATWRAAGAVCFDVDSTLCEDESIDELAAFLGVGEQVAALTARQAAGRWCCTGVGRCGAGFLRDARHHPPFHAPTILLSSAMGGSTKFEDALAARLGIMKPSASDVDRFLAAHPPRLSPGIPELVARLQAKGTPVFLVSGGFRAIINPIADSLKIPRARVFANTILFDAGGAYAGFDAAEHTSRSGGKLAAVRDIRATHGVTPPVVVVGDGATDAEAVAPDGAAMFIG